MEESALRESAVRERRSVILMIRLTPEEQARVDDLARRSSLPVASYVRASALRERLPPVVPAVNFDAIQQLRRIGNNLNQALVAVHTRGVPSSFRPLLLELVTLCRKLRAELAGKVAEDYERTPVVQPANDTDLCEDSPEAVPETITETVTEDAR